MIFARARFAAALFVLSSCAPRAYICRPASNRDYLPRLKEIIKGAKEKLYISQLYFHMDETTRPLVFLLNEAVDRGVDVRCILEDSVSYNAEALPLLKRIGVDARPDSGDVFSHSKFVVADGEKVIMGSTNLSSTSIDRNNETNVFIKDKKLGQWFEEYFMAMWNGDASPGSITSGSVTTVETSFADEALIGMFESAKERIALLIYGIKIYPGETENPVMKVLDALFAAADRGVKTEAVMEKSDYNDTLNKMTDEAAEYFRTRGVDVLFDNEKIITHAKLAVADDSVMIGSSNWGYGGFELYREANIVIKDEALAKYFYMYFLMVKEQGSAK
ncbi:MAG: phosphatidylserine/phosphatidylglycerophosphate/cardiolipin synthase family protein [Candidatus Omnitrophota bacterium]|nr:phosphatidylserine/phosphatidylglycerophosphate/cardiolipin synthase family protein [Candidatus Omnitrophota bacterium]MBU2528073.1 phosphatidylserine/phosphatidylglycerophosphate/cardiolipin synthase family protein [bacterium]MBU3929920.1 phosphatidylserine/phosphatidylglycerophosphate/cardiolipin synthase family protein [bacterium]MBU4122644.1 phosphatidylserine/phosphatidylglycerophosphate/cardiolipin synthase family protein [bacterium]